MWCFSILVTSTLHAEKLHHRTFSPPNNQYDSELIWNHSCWLWLWFRGVWPGVRLAVLSASRCLLALGCVLALSPVLLLRLQSFLHLCVVVESFPDRINNVLLRNYCKKSLNWLQFTQKHGLNLTIYEFLTVEKGRLYFNTCWGRVSVK